MGKVKVLHKGQCPSHLRQVQKYNKHYITLNRNYFANKCPDPATALSYWNRRFPGGQCQALSYWVPHKFNGHHFGACSPYGPYGKKALDLGYVKHLMSGHPGYKRFKK